MKFPLYQVPPEQQPAEPDVAPACWTCGRRDSARFAFSYVMHPCDACGKDVPFVDSGELARCPHCQRLNEWPKEWPFHPEEDADSFTVCGDCLIAGRAVVVHESELGIVSYSEALRGLTSGGSEDHEGVAAARLGLQTEILNERSDGSSEIGVRVPESVLFELLRTPSYPTLQGEHWPFHCGRFMAFVGNWGQDDFERASPGEGREWFARHFRSSGDWEQLWDWLPDRTSMSCVFRCRDCGLHAVFVDFD